MSTTYWKLAWSRPGEPDRTFGTFLDPDRAKFRAREAVERTIREGYEVREVKLGQRWLITGKGGMPQFLELAELGFDV